jgi:hypothetical protein
MRILTVCVLLLGLQLVLPAQSGLKVGIFGVPHYSYLFNGDDNSLPPQQYQLESMPVMSGGISLGLGLGNYFGIRFSPTYAQQGGKYSAQTGLTDEDITVFTERLDYVKLPLMIGLNTSPLRRKFIFSVYLGASANLLTSVKSFNNNPLLAIQPTPGQVVLPQPIDRYRSLVWSMMGETGFDIQLPPENFMLNLRVRADYAFTDAENKGVLVRVQQGGTVRSERYWQYIRGVNTRNDETIGINVGLLIGVTYNFR